MMKFLIYFKYFFCQNKFYYLGKYVETILIK